MKLDRYVSTGIILASVTPATDIKASLVDHGMISELENLLSIPGKDLDQDSLIIDTSKLYLKYVRPE